MSRPLHVTVLGSSTAFMTVPHRTTRHDGPYPEHLDSELEQLGVTARTTSFTRWHGMIHEARRDLELYRVSMPDVIVLNYGMAECQPRVMPTWFYRHFVTWMSGTRRHEVLYRRRITPILWKLVRNYQRRASQLLGGRTHRLGPVRFKLELTKTLRALRLDHAPLILVLDIDPVTEKVERFIPGLQGRVDEYNQHIKAVVKSFDNPDIRYVETSKVVLHLGLEEGLPDGFHRSSLGHRQVATAIAEEIAPWAKSTFA